MAAQRKAVARAQRIEAAETRLAGVELPEGEGAWARMARAAALQRVREMGLPLRRDEYWKYTDPSVLAAPQAPSAALLNLRTEEMIFAATDRLKLVFIDGVFDPDQSDDPQLAGVEIEQLGAAAAHDIHWAQEVYGTLEADAHKPVHRPFAALNTALARDGVLIRVKNSPDRPVCLVYLRSAPDSDALLHHCIRIEDGAALTLLEDGPAAARLSSVMEVELGESSRLDHVRAQGRDHERCAITHVFGRLAADAALRSFTLTTNGKLTRNEVLVRLVGRDASAHVAGASVGDGAFLQDDTVFIHHQAERCESRQVFKKVLRNGATGVFQGKILVDSNAQLTDGYQLSQGLMLGGDSQFLARPELEIYADNVKCSHGATSGEIDDDQLFYLRSRGVPEAEAKGLLVLAFLAEAINEIEDQSLAEEFRRRLSAWLERHRG